MYFCVSDWFNYKIVEADSALEAAQQLTNDIRIKRIPPRKLLGSSVVCAMCACYEGELEIMMESCFDDMERVLILDLYKYTHHFEYA